MPGAIRVPRPLAPAPEIWGGFECSVTRVRDEWRDQVRETGHHDRLEDLERVAAIGIGTLRYPFLWERVRDDVRNDGTWPWHDRQMGRLRALGLDVIAGLIHHGSGPSGTSLLDPGFPAGLARHAGQVAERYPDILRWTPVNEPLTTARFSCLYGFWYPHLRDTHAFLRALAGQCRAVMLAMRAIRRQVPGAQLVQTEDVGCTFATVPLRDQAQYENDRRWLSLDLLCGRVDRAHPWRGTIEEAGVSARHLDELATGEAAPDIIGVNYYVTSERFLDHRTALYPPHLHGGNGHLSYVDTEAVRVPDCTEERGWLPRLHEVWSRYERPIAVTEAHLGCEDGAEQARWFLEAWTAAQKLQSQGVDVRAVTAWALAGAIDWDSLLQSRAGRAECGIWDLNSRREPRLLAQVIRSLAGGEAFEHPALERPGWWRRADRFPPPGPADAEWQLPGAG